MARCRMFLERRGNLLAMEPVGGLCTAAVGDLFGGFGGFEVFEAVLDVEGFIGEDVVIFDGFLVDGFDKFDLFLEFDYDGDDGPGRCRCRDPRMLSRYLCAFSLLVVTCSIRPA